MHEVNISLQIEEMYSSEFSSIFFILMCNIIKRWTLKLPYF